MNRGQHDMKTKVRGHCVQLAVLLSLAGLSCWADAGIDLNGAWSLKGWATPVEGSIRTLADVPTETLDVPATVPGSYELDLVAAGLLPDLFKANNHYAPRKYEGHQWLYTRTFVCPDFPKGEKAMLQFDGLDTLADVFLNGRKVGEARNMFIPHEFDVTKAVRRGATNELAVLFRSVVVESQFKDIGAIGNAGSSAELEGFRKPAHMIGWDILPRMMSAGIFRDTRLVVRGPERIRDFFCAQIAFDPEQRSARYLLDLRLEGAFARLDTSRLNVTVSRKGGVVARTGVNVVDWTPRLWFGLSNADLWWPRGWGEPALYDVKIEWCDRADGRVFAEKSFRLGVKKVEFVLADFIDKDRPGEMKFIVNGKPCFIRGTSWVPVDALHARDKDRIIPTLELVREANCNMIRVWGGGLYEPELFWDWCDENGVMVWQDFCFACTQYPQNDTSLAEEVRHEAKEVVKRLRNHASLALWCGNNENDSVFALGPWKAHGGDPNKDVFSRKILPDVLREFDPTHPYLPSSPYINADVMAGRALSTEGHYYRRWWKGEIITNTPVKFFSEIGLHGCPSVASIREMFSPDKVYPFTSPAASNKMWQTRYVPYSPTDYLSNELVPAEPPKGVFEFNDEWVLRGLIVFRERYGRSKWDGCRNHRMILQMAMLFDEIETSLDGFALQSQCAQAEGMKFIVEHCRVHKFAQKTGMTWWNVRDGWPNISDAVVDYYGRRKRAFEAIARAQRDVLVMVDEDHALRVVNDTLEPVAGHAVLTDAETGRVVFDGDFACDANAVATVGKLSLKGQGVVKIRYTTGSQTFDSHYLYGEPKFKFADYRRWMGL